MQSHSKPEQLHHLRLHNGTIWRWTRPLIEIGSNGKPQLRIEHRVTSAGPTICDMIANIAFCIGLSHYLADQKNAPETKLSFSKARHNFYHAAKNGIHAKIDWLDGKKHTISDLLLSSLIPNAKKSLLALGVNQQDVTYYLDDVLKQRIKHQQCGSHWQRAFVEKYGPDMQQLVQVYRERQASNLPVFEWAI